MKIKKISCEQYAGIRDKDISFSDGVNVVYGKNESGKSTLVNLLSRTLFQDVVLDRSTKKGKSFDEGFFPLVAEGKTELTTIDGSVTLEADGLYELNKLWDKNNNKSICRASLSTPDGVLRGDEVITEKLREILGYGEGVYKDMLFSSQNNADQALRETLESTKGADPKAGKGVDFKTEIADVLTRSFFESDGVSIDAISKEIQNKIDKLAGKHWDIAAEIPEKKTGRWNKEVGEVLAAYYKLEDVLKDLEKRKSLEEDVDRADAAYRERKEAENFAQESFERFQKYESKLKNRKSLEKNSIYLKEKIEKYSAAFMDWPICSELLNRAEKLLSERERREIFNKYREAKSLHDALEEQRVAHEKRVCPTDADINVIDSAEKTIKLLENKLCGMNLAAQIKMYGGRGIEITSLRTGEKIDVTDEKTVLSEAVRISVPDVLEMQLSPADLDVVATEKMLLEQRETMRANFEKYRVDSLDALKDERRQYLDEEREIGVKEKQLKVILGDVLYSDLEAQCSHSGEIRSKEEIDTAISLLCGSKSLVTFIAEKKARMDVYVKDFVDEESLESELKVARDEYNKAMEAIKEEEIPEEYRNKDPEWYRQSLRNNLEISRKNSESALEKKSVCRGALKAFEETKGDLEAQAEEAAWKLDLLKTELAHWEHIKKVFDEQREKIASSPLHDLAESFSKYLKMITGGKVSSRFPDEKKLDMKVLSDDCALDYEKLSEGTKETVSLAFRLSVLDHLFPKGGGVIVFDDPFVSMDSERTLQAIKLIQECASRHQVIFLTCRKEYADMLKGTRIDL